MMVPAQLIRYTWFVAMTLYAHFWLSEAAVIISLHHHEEMSLTSMARRILLQGNSNLMLQQGLSKSPDEELQAGGSSSSSTKKKKKNLVCRTLRRRCLRMSDDNIAPTVEPTVDPAVDPPVADLPTLPRDPESGVQQAMSPPPAARTNPSNLLAPPLSGGSSAGPGLMSTGKAGLGSNMASKVGITAGVGVTGVAFLIVGLLYYFKPDILLCCKTCVRVQIFHHNASHK